MEKTSTILPLLKQFTTTLCPSIILFNGGAQASMTPMLVSQCKEKLGFVLNDDDISWFVSTFSLCAILGMLLACKLINYSRKVSALVAVCLATVSAIGTYIASSYTILICTRVFLGMSIGIAAITTPIYIGECASPKYRALLLAVPGFCLILGEILSHIVSINYGFDKTLLMATVFLLIDLCNILCSPESPSLLAVKGKYEECKKAFRWLRGSDEETELEELIKDTKSTLKDQAPNPTSSSIKELQQTLIKMKKKSFYAPIVLLQLLFIINETSAGTLFDPFAYKIIHEVVGDEANVPAIIYSIDIQRLVATILAIFIFKQFKRRVLFLTFIPLSISILFITAAYTYAKDKNSSWHNQYVGIALIHLLILFYTIGTDPLSHIMFGELLSLQLRNISTVLVCLSFFLCFFVHMKTFLSLVSSIGFYGTYSLYGSIALVCFLVLFFYLPETKDKTLLDIELEFRKKEKTYKNEKNIEMETFISCQHR